MVKRSGVKTKPKKQRDAEEGEQNLEESVEKDKKKRKRIKNQNEKKSFKQQQMMPISSQSQKCPEKPLHAQNQYQKYYEEEGINNDYSIEGQIRNVKVKRHQKSFQNSSQQINFLQNKVIANQISRRETKDFELPYNQKQIAPKLENPISLSQVQNVKNKRNKNGCKLGRPYGKNQKIDQQPDPMETVYYKFLQYFRSMGLPHQLNLKDKIISQIDMKKLSQKHSDIEIENGIGDCWEIKQRQIQKINQSSVIKNIQKFIEENKSRNYTEEILIQIFIECSNYSHQRWTHQIYDLLSEVLLRLKQSQPIQLEETDIIFSRLEGMNRQCLSKQVRYYLQKPPSEQQAKKIFNRLFNDLKIIIGDLLGADYDSLQKKLKEKISIQKSLKEINRRK